MATAQASVTRDIDLLRRLERLPFSWMQGRLLIMGGLGYTFDASSNAIVAFILPTATTLFKLTNAQTGLLGSSVLIGYLVGALFAGILGDQIGRKRIMMHALALYCSASLLAACSMNWGFLFWTRVVAGIGTGAEAAIVAPFLSEFIQGRYRGRYVGSLAGFFSFGFVFAAIIGYLIVPANYLGWRIVQVITAVPIIMLLWWRRALPESPRWLLQKHRYAEAEQVVSRLEKDVERSTGHALPPTSSIVLRSATSTADGSWISNLRMLWSRPLRRHSVMLWVLWVAITFSFYGFFTWIPSLLVRQGLTVTRSFRYSIMIYLAQIPGYYSAAFLCEKLDRKWTMIAYMFGGALSALLMANSRDHITIILFGCFLSFFMNGTYAVIYAYTPELYPTAIRATGMGVASAVGRVGGILAPIIIGVTFAKIGFGGVFSLTTLILLIGTITVAFLGTHTSGKALEEIGLQEMSSQIE